MRDEPPDPPATQHERLMWARSAANFVAEVGKEEKEEAGNCAASRALGSLFLSAKSLQSHPDTETPRPREGEGKGESGRQGQGGRTVRANVGR